VTLYLLRHGIAEDKTVDKPDRDRTLTPRGRARMRRAAVGLRVLVGHVDEIFTSPYPRAAETAAIAAASLPKGPKPRTLDALAHGTSPMEALRLLRSVAKGEHVMLVGHEPDFSYFAANLLGLPGEGLIHVRKASLLHFDLPMLRAGVARLESLVPSRLM